MVFIGLRFGECGEEGRKGGREKGEKGKKGIGDFWVGVVECWSIGVMGCGF